MPRLLLVEDEHVNRELFRRRLERKGYAVIAAEDGSSAVALTKTERPDLVLMDLGLPDIDGWEATRRIKADPATATVPVVALSAHATNDAREKALAAGCEEFETKPVNWDVLFKKIEASIHKAVERARRTAVPPAPADDEVDLGASAPVADPDALTAVRHGSGGSQPASAEPAGAENDEAVRPKQILVVEDNDANRVMLCRRLNKHGYETAEAADGREALDAVRKQRFDLVLCDIMMPGVDGYAVLREMKADPQLQPIPIIMISAVDEMASVVRCVEMGAEDYLQKPYDPVLLHARINACLDKRRLRDRELAYLRAVTALTEAAVRVERGTFDPALLAAVTVRGDALGTLARVFDRMARQLQARVQQVQIDGPGLSAGESDEKEPVREVARAAEANPFDKAREHPDGPGAGRQTHGTEPKPGAETMILPARPK